MNMPKQDQAPPTPSAVRVVLVHGTWARGFLWNGPSKSGMPRWFEPESPFAEKLFDAMRELGLEPVLEEPVFEWSGRNALLHRAEAAERLAKVLTQTAPATCLVVAHSHAGNIAFKALDLAALDDHKAFERIRVITMSTPFVGLYWPADGAPNVERLMLALFLLQLGFGLSTLHWLTPDMPLWLPYALAALPFFFGFRLCYGIKEEQLAMAPHARADCLAKRLFLGNKYFQVGDFSPHTLVVRGVEDEASLAISMAAATGRLLQFLRDVSYRLFHGGGRAVLLMGAILSVLVALLAFYESLVRAGFASGPPPADGMHSTGIVVSLIAVVPPLLLGGVAAVGRVLAGFAAGRELSLIPNLEVSVATAPDLSVKPRMTRDRGITIATLPRRGRPLPHIRHMIYEDPDIFHPIGMWLPDAFASEIVKARGVERREQ